MNIKIRLDYMKSIMIGVVGSLIVLNIVNIIYGEPIWQIKRIIWFGEESNFSTWWSSMMFAFAAVMAYQCSITSSSNRSENIIWKSLGVLLLLMCCDEVAMFHEHFGKLMNKYSLMLDQARSEWTIYFGIPVIILFCILAFQLKKCLKDSKKAKKFMLIGAALFILGAIILDFVINFIPKESMWVLKIEILFEESFELIGLMIFNFGLIEHFKFLANGKVKLDNQT